MKMSQYWAGQAGAIHFDDLLMVEKFVEPAPEMPARLHHNHPGRRNIQAERLEKGGVGALHTLRHDNDDNPPDRQGHGRPEIDGVAGENTTSPPNRTGMQPPNARRCREKPRKIRQRLPVKPRVERTT